MPFGVVFVEINISPVLLMIFLFVTKFPEAPPSDFKRNMGIISAVDSWNTFAYPCLPEFHGLDGGCFACVARSACFTCLSECPGAPPGMNHETHR